MHKNEADCRPVSTKDDQLHTSPDEPPILAQMDNTEMDDAEPIPEKRRKTDLSIFRFYFAFINWRRATIFMVFQISLAFLSSFPGKFTYPWWLSSCAFWSHADMTQSSGSSGGQTRTLRFKIAGRRIILGYMQAFKELHSLLLL